MGINEEIKKLLREGGQEWVDNRLIGGKGTDC